MPRCARLTSPGRTFNPPPTNAGIDALTDGWHSIDRIRIGIFPGNRAPRGLAVVQAIRRLAPDVPVFVITGGGPGLSIAGAAALARPAMATAGGAAGPAAMRSST